MGRVEMLAMDGASTTLDTAVHNGGRYVKRATHDGAYRTGRSNASAGDGRYAGNERHLVDRKARRGLG